MGASGSMPRRLLVLAWVGLCAVSGAHAQEEGSTVDACLKAWGKHPFGRNPSYRTMSTSVKVFGIGRASSDTEVTDKPVLIVVNPGVNVMGGSTIELLNPNGWYCLRTTVNVMGGMNLKAHCKAHLANSSGQVLSEGNVDGRTISVLGAVEVDRVGCS